MAMRKRKYLYSCPINCSVCFHNSSPDCCGSRNGASKRNHLHCHCGPHEQPVRNGGAFLVETDKHGMVTCNWLIVLHTRLKSRRIKPLLCFRTWMWNSRNQSGLSEEYGSQGDLPGTCLKREEGVQQRKSSSQGSQRLGEEVLKYVTEVSSSGHKKNIQSRTDSANASNGTPNWRANLSEAIPNTSSL